MSMSMPNNMSGTAYGSNQAPPVVRAPPVAPGGQASQPMRPPPSPLAQQQFAAQQQPQSQPTQMNGNISFSLNPASMASGYSAAASMLGNSNMPLIPQSVNKQLPNQSFNVSVNPVQAVNGVQAAVSMASSLNAVMNANQQAPLIPKRPGNN